MTDVSLDIDLKFADCMLRLQLFTVPDLAKELGVDYFDLRDFLQAKMGYDYYIRITKGSSGSKGRARRSKHLYSTAIDVSVDLVCLLELTLAKDYTVYDLSNILKIDPDVLLKTAIDRRYDINFIERLDFDELADMQNVSRSDLYKCSDVDSLCEMLICRPAELEKLLYSICDHDGVEVKRLMLNHIGGHSYSDVKLKSMSDRTFSNRSNYSSTVDHLHFDYDFSINRGKSFDSDVLHLFLDRFSTEEISSILNARIEDVNNVLTSNNVTRHMFRRADHSKIAELHLDRIKENRSIDVEILKSRFSEGRLTLTDFCEEITFPVFLKSFLTKMQFLDKNDVRTNTSKIGNRMKGSKSIEFCNYAALKSVEEDPSFAKLLSAELSSKFEVERLYQISELRAESNRLDICKSLIRRARKLRCEDGFCNKLFDALKLSIDGSDAKSLNAYDSRLYLLADDEMSAKERLVKDLLDELDIEYRYNDRTLLDGLEIDFRIDSVRVCIEVSPISSHHSNSYSNSRFYSSKPRTYHYDKYVKCKSLGYDLITLYEFDLDRDSFERVTRHFLKSRLGHADFVITESTNLELRQLSSSRFRQIASQFWLQPSVSAELYFEVFDRDTIAVLSVDCRSPVTEVSSLCVKPGLKLDSSALYKIADILSDITNSSRVLFTTDNDKDSYIEMISSRFRLSHESGPTSIYLSWSDPLNDRFGSSLDCQSSKLNYEGVDIMSLVPIIDDVSEDEYIETSLHHSSDDKIGYDVMYSSGCTKWILEREV